jgi:diadenosine tetraphosphatase ApaH/serine/threonine PP2A family protein phosphatase
MHASPADHLFSYRLTPDLADDELKKEVEGVRADVLLVGHTLLPMSRGAWTKVILNPGSIGQPLDGDPRASYAVIQDGVAEIRRVAYDIKATVTGIQDMGLASDVAKALIEILVTGKPWTGPPSGAAAEHDG